MGVPEMANLRLDSRRDVGKTSPFDGSYEALTDFSAGASFVLALDETDNIFALRLIAQS